MSNTIDEKVVEMRFDNRQFEQNVSTTMSTLDKLKQKLHLDGATKGLENVASASDNLEITATKAGFHLSDVWENVSRTFETKIADRVVNAAERMAKALTIEPVKAGFDEYETKIGAIQTIMSNTASKGTTMEDVTNVLGELNEYADKTIYNFAEMTRNIGTFTAAGVGLEESAAAIQGISNLAAASGSTSQQASTAMYQLSQALSSGTVKLMDWNSVVNAGMGGEKFQEALKATAREHGVAVDDLIAKNGSFRESLQEGWITADVLNETLRKFTVEGAKEYADSMVKSGKYTQEQADALIKEAQAMEDAATKVKTFTQLWDTLKESAQSGWSQTWEIIVGDFEEAQEFLGYLSDTIGSLIGASADARNSMLQDWKTLGGRADLIEAVKNVFDALGGVLAPLRDGFREIFPPMTGEKLAAFTKGLKDLTAKLKIGDETADKLKRTFKGVFAVIDIARMVIVAVVKAIASLFGGVGELGGGLLEITARIGDFLVKLRDIVSETGVVNSVFKGIAAVLKIVVGAVGAFLKLVGRSIAFPALDLISRVLSKLGIKMEGLSDSADSMREGVSDSVKSMGDAFKNSVFFKILDFLWKTLQVIGKIVGKVFSAIADGFKRMTGAASFSDLMNLIDTVSLSAILVFIVKIAKKVSGLFGTMDDLKERLGGVLDSVSGAFEGFQKQMKAQALMKIAIAIGILAAAILVLSFLDPKKIGVALGAVASALTGLLVTLKVLSKVQLPEQANSVKKFASALVPVAIAVLILASALKKLSKLSPKELAVGLAGVLGLLAGIIVILKVFDSMKSSTKGMFSAGMAMVAVAIAIAILGAAVDDFSKMSWSELGKSGVALAGLAAGIAVMGLALKLVPKSSALQAAGLVITAGAMYILAGAVKVFSLIDTASAAKGLIVMSIGLAAMAVALKVMEKSWATALMMPLVAESLVILAGALKLFGMLSMDEIGRGLVALGGSLILLGVALNVMKSAWAAALVLPIVAASMIILAGALHLFALLEWDQIARGLVALGGSLLIMAAGLTLMQWALPGAIALTVASVGLLALAGALAALGALGWAVIGTGIALLTVALLGLAVGLTAMLIALPGALALTVAATGFLLLASGIVALTAAMAGGVGVIITGLTSILLAIIGLVPAMIAAIAAGIVAFCVELAAGGAAITAAIVAIVLALCAALIKIVPKLLDTLGVLLDALLEFIVEYIPKIVVAGMKLIIGLLEGIAANIPKIAKAGADIIIAFLRAMGVQIPRVVDAGMKMVIDLINGMADALRNNGPKFRAALKNLVDAAFDAIGLGKVIDTGKRIMDGLIQGIKNGAKKVKDTLISTVKNAWNSVLDFLGINSPSRLAAEAGMYVDEGLAQGLKQYSSVVDKEALGVGETAMDSLGKAIGDATSKVGGGIDLQPTIRPVLDLSEVRAGAATIGSMLNSNATVGAAATAGAINASMNGRVQNRGNDDIISAIDKLRKDIAGMNTTTYQINGITYNGDADIEEAFRTLTRAARVERRV